MRGGCGPEIRVVSRFFWGGQCGNSAQVVVVCRRLFIVDCKVARAERAALRAVQRMNIANRCSSLARCRVCVRLY
ncbi:hypothetical protein PSEUDO9AG_50688 [Pseudomonas sp. 9Ag]|nr:hypothetical protein PSEUDO9AG_50688 [Pseudomonas sp. 9Ag]